MTGPAPAPRTKATKAIVGAVVALAGALTTAGSDGSLSWLDLALSITAAIATSGGVWGTTNKVKGRHELDR